MSDILYQDNLVCILNPQCERGVIVYTHYRQPEGQESLCKTGLKTGKQLHSEGINFGRNIYHPYIFFRAPYDSNESQEHRIYIRVDPDKTFVFSSEIRAKYSPLFKTNSIEYNISMENELNKSKKTLTKYLSIIKENSMMKENNKQYLYNLYSSKICNYSKKYKYPYNDAPIERNSEILVSIPHLTPNYFVNCFTPLKI